MIVAIVAGCIGGDEEDNVSDEIEKAYDGTLSSLLLGIDDVPEGYFVCDGNDSMASHLAMFNTDNFGFSGENESIFYRAIVNNGNGYTTAALYEWVVRNNSVNDDTFDKIKLRFQEFIAAVERGEIPEGVSEAVLDGTYTQYEFQDIGDEAFANERIFSPFTEDEYVLEINTTYYLLFEKEDAIVMIYGYNDGGLGLDEYEDILRSIAERI